MDEETNANPAWLFNPNLLCLYHRNNECHKCSEYMMHQALAFSEVDPSWAKADEERRNYLRDKFGKGSITAEMTQRDSKISELNGAYSTLKQSYEQIRVENVQLTEERAHYRSRAHKLDDQLADLTKTLHSRDDEIHRLRKELSEFRDDAESNASSKKRKLAVPFMEYHPNHQSTSPSISERSDSPIGFIMSPTESAQLAASPTEPVTLAQLEEYFRILKMSELPDRKPAWPVYRMLEAVKDRAITLPTADRSIVQQAVIDRFYIPRFAVDQRSNQPSRSSVHQARQAAEHAAALQRKADNKPPALNAANEIIAKWLCQAPADKPRTLLGIFKNPTENTVSIRSMRGRRLVQSREAIIENGTIATIRFAYFIAAIEVVLTPAFYRNFITNNAIIVEYPTPAAVNYPHDPRNISLDSIARFYAKQGLHIEDIEDAAFYAYLWLRDVRTTNNEVTLRLYHLRHRVYPQLLVHGLPAGHNEDYMNESGVITHTPSTPTPGNVLTGISMFSETSNANNSNPVASSSSTMDTV
ncbi:hypothetical protein F5880DRAFT_1669525 [Lentinula raphanica]|nr:hypothetical protein F5880DRAFT_1669525 [Lentinula raphanica]